MAEKIPSNWATIVLLILGIVGSSYGLNNDLTPDTFFGFGKRNSVWDTYEYPLRGYWLAALIAIGMVLFSLFAPSPDHAKWLERKKRENDTGREALETEARVLEERAAALRGQARL